MLLAVFAVFTLLYIIFISYLKKGWEKIETPKDETGHYCSVTVVITVRNEAGNIKHLLSDLDHQSYSKDKFEVIIFNDHSEDQTYNIARKFADQSDMNIHLMHLQGGELSPKKRAITNAMKILKGELVVITDGDCRLKKEWLMTIVNFYNITGSTFISGPVTFDRSRGFWGKLMNIEFASLIGSGAASLYYKKPVMCNAANMAFTRKAFEEVNGFLGNEDKASGDDIFLMRKIFEKHPGKVNFLKDKKAIVYTKPERTFSLFFNQRIRWAGKWSHVSGVENKLTPLFIFFYHLLTLATFFVYIRTFDLMVVFLMLFFVRYVAEKRFLSNVSRFLGKRIGAIYYVFASAFYPFYAVLMALSTMKGKYVWKGKTYYK